VNALKLTNKEIRQAAEAHGLTTHSLREMLRKPGVAPSSWICVSKPQTAQRLTAGICGILAQVSAESRDQSQRIYTQAEVVRAIELALETASTPRG